MILLLSIRFTSGGSHKRIVPRQHLVANIPCELSAMTPLHPIATLTAPVVAAGSALIWVPARLWALSSKICAPQWACIRTSATRLGGWLPLRYNLFHARTLPVSSSLTPYTSCISGQSTKLSSLIQHKLKVLSENLHYRRASLVHCTSHFARTSSCSSLTSAKST